MTSTTSHRPRFLALSLLAVAPGCSSTPHATTTLTSSPSSGAALGRAQPLDNAAATDSSTVPSAATVPLRVVTGTRTPLPAGLHPHVGIAQPRNGATLRTNRAEVRLSVTDWPAPQDMRHIHLVLDNEPYRRVDDPSRPIVLENLSEGTHVLRAFPGWGSHESVKVEGAFASSVFHVGRRSEGAAFDPHAPTLTYSRPTGEYRGANADRVLLDFYVTNVRGSSPAPCGPADLCAPSLDAPGNELSATGYRVRYAIDGTARGELTTWVPYFIEGLGDGEHTIVLDLLGPDGRPTAGRFDHTERTIRVDRRPAPGVSGSPTPAGHDGAH